MKMHIQNEFTNQKKASTDEMRRVEAFFEAFVLRGRQIL